MGGNVSAQAFDQKVGFSLKFQRIIWREPSLPGAYQNFTISQIFQRMDGYE
jgi:hypothetical protein